MDGQVWQLPTGRWRIRWRTPDGRRPSRTFRTRAAADRALRSAIDDAERGTGYVDKKVTVSALADEWLVAVRLSVKPRTYDAYAQHVRDHITPRLGAARAHAIDRALLQRFVSDLSHTHSAKTTICIFATLRQVLASGDLPPVRGVRLPRIERPEIEPPIPTQVEQLAAAIDPPFWALVRLCGYCGLRQGEALALRVHDLEWETGRIRVSGSLDQRTQTRESPKNGHGRWVTMPQSVAESLQAHLAEFPTGEYVFQRADGRPWKASRVWESWNAARIACDLEHVDFHHLRHAAASIMIRAGLTAKRIQTELGHSDPAFTLRVYGHLFPDEIDIGRRQVDKLLAELHHTEPQEQHPAWTTSGRVGE